VNGKQQKSLDNKELSKPGQGGTRKGPRSAEPQTAAREQPDPTKTLLERCVETENLNLAWKRVRGNNGSAGIDGMSVEEAKGYLRKNWLRIKAELLSGSYRPQPVKRVEIPKPGGGVRQLGIPTVVDRLIQQAILQVLQPLWDPTFHPNSFGFRPKRSAHQAIKQAQEFVQEGRHWCVDVDLEKFFDTVNHDVLMAKVAKRIEDKRLLGLIRRYLKAGIMEQGVCLEREMGTPQGGPLSPLLANLLLNEVDWELAKRGLAFCRYADDCNLYLRSKRAAQRGMKTMHQLMSKLGLRINPAKSAVARVWERKFLGYALWIAPKGIVKRGVSHKAMGKFKDRIRQMTGRSCGRSVQQIVKELRIYLMGWRNYFGLSDTPKVFAKLDAWIRRRLRVVHLKQWKTKRACYRELIARGLTVETARSIASNRRCYWAMSDFAVNVAFPIKYFDALGLPRLVV
jgi:RNA-directed DNA polymerase